MTRGAQMVRYYGWYSNKMRGVCQRGLPQQLVVRRLGVSPPPPAKLPSKRWRDLILRVWHVGPLRCPACQNPMRIIGRLKRSHGQNRSVGMRTSCLSRSKVLPWRLLISARAHHGPVVGSRHDPG